MADAQAAPKEAQAPVVEAPPARRESILDKIAEDQAVSRARVSERYKPVMSTADLVERETSLQYLVEHIMTEGIDWGWVPGTKPSGNEKPGEYRAKPTLFKAGAERTNAFFGYVPEYIVEQRIEEWRPDVFGEMLFYYTYRCTLSRDGNAVGQGIGSASTWESKYRYRNSERTCPNCGAANVRKSKPKTNQREEPGFYCWEKTGGCGATFRADDKAITDQVLGKVPNADIADVINTVQKMGQKRAYVAATLTATGLSGRFTQDLEDLPLPPSPPTPTAAPEPSHQRNTPEQQAALAQEIIDRKKAEAAASAPPPAAPFVATDADIPPEMGGAPPARETLEQAKARMLRDLTAPLMKLANHPKAFSDLKQQLMEALGWDEGKARFEEILADFEGKDGKPIRQFDDVSGKPIPSLRFTTTGQVKQCATRMFELIWVAAQKVREEAAEVK